MLGSQETRAGATAIADNGGSYVDWTAIIAGGVFAAAISFVLAAFGGALGLSITSLRQGEGASGMWLLIAAGIWFVWMSISSFAAGGYLAGRLHRPQPGATAEENETRDGAHGLVVWAVGALVGAVIAAATIGGATSTAVEATSSVAGGVAESEINHLAGTMFRTEASTLPIDPATRAEAAQLLTRSLTTGEMGEADRTYLARIVATSGGIDPATARTQVDATITALETAQAEVVAAAEQARVAGVITGFLVAATLLVGAAAAYAAAALGGQHRDENTTLAARSVRPAI